MSWLASSERVLQFGFYLIIAVGVFYSIIDRKSVV